MIKTRPGVSGLYGCFLPSGPIWQCAAGLSLFGRSTVLGCPVLRICEFVVIREAHVMPSDANVCPVGHTSSKRQDCANRGAIYEARDCPRDAV